MPSDIADLSSVVNSVQYDSNVMTENLDLFSSTFQDIF